MAGIHASFTPLSYSFLLVSLHLATVVVFLSVSFVLGASVPLLVVSFFVGQWNAGRKAATRRPSAASHSHAVGPPQQNTAPMATEQMIQHDVPKTILPSG